MKAFVSKNWTDKERLELVFAIINSMRERKINRLQSCDFYEGTAVLYDQAMSSIDLIEKAVSQPAKFLEINREKFKKFILPK